MKTGHLMNWGARLSKVSWQILSNSVSLSSWSSWLSGNFATASPLLFTPVMCDKINETSVYEYGMANTPEGFSLHFSLITHKLDGERCPDFIFLFLYFKRNENWLLFFCEDTKIESLLQKLDPLLLRHWSSTPITFANVYWQTFRRKLLAGGSRLRM